jgi:hypothetical protein
MSRYSRNQILGAAVILLVVVNIAWRIISGWGLITVHADKAPLSRIVASIARQGGIDLRTDLDPATPVTLNIDRVPLTEALEDLAIVVDARWRLAYFLGPDRRDVRGALTDWQAGTKNDDWIWIEHRLPPLVEDDPDAAPPDPRQDRVLVKADGPADLQALLHQAAGLADAATVLPKAWNPSIASLPGTARVGDVVSRLAKAGHGTSTEVFLLTHGRHVARGERPEGDDGGGFRWGNLEQMQLRVSLLPAAKRPEAQKRLDDMKAMQALSPEERRARWQAMRDSPAGLDRMQDRMENRDAKMTPDQRAARYASYLSNRAAAIGR